ncbi:piggyBac transposable element-derived protein 4-like [Aplysia californica]|uniref:PiggyBac transposable element-derived protein 4-like n=1 Tax=Aplysia californica TaxID=6500 RepID=A0ABM0ZX27_APLCA|nr:piggyBac transposable element-derived protein 4-like [Aplysia californica]
MMKEIAKETNRYANHFVKSTQLTQVSCLSSWEDTDADELWAFFGLITGMGIIRVASFQDYWSTDAVYSLPFFPSIMTRERFQNLLTFLHFSDEKFIPRGEEGHDPLFKISSFLNCLAENFSKNYYPTTNIAIDEAMISWKGRCNVSAPVYGHRNQDRFGLKIFQLCDSSNAYCCRFEVYTGKKEVSPKGVDYDMAMRLLSPYLGCGHRLFIDSFFTAPVLFKDLLAAKTTACGTVRLNRKGLSKMPQNRKKVVKRKGDVISMTTGSMNHIRIIGQQQVNFLTSIHTDSMSDTGGQDRTGEQVNMLDAVREHSKHMGAVSRSDRLVELSYVKLRRMKWWKKVFFHFFMLAERNAYLLYKESTQQPMNYAVFRRELAKEMASQSPPRLPPRHAALQTGSSSLHRLTARHFPSKILHPAGFEKRRPRTRLCVVCSTRTGKRKVPGDGRRRKETTVECVDCNVGLCVIPCFELYHTQKDYKRSYRRLQEVQVQGQDNSAEVSSSSSSE